MKPTYANVVNMGKLQGVAGTVAKGMPMTFDELCQRTRELALNGADWLCTLHDDTVFDAYCELSQVGELDKDKLELAFVEGRRTFRMANGWAIVWTTARADYDQFDAEELECHDWNGKTLRRVLVEPGNLVYQRSRYMSGAWCWDEDPRETERKIQETIAKEQAEAEEKKRIREDGLTWLRSADLSCTHEDAFDAELRLRGLTWKDLREEEKRRDEEVAAKERADEWKRCRSAFVDGCTIVDPGRDARKGIAGSDCNVYRNVRVVPHWEKKDDVHEARVEVAASRPFDERRDFVGSLWWVAKRLSDGDYRIAEPDECLPPAEVIDRQKPHRLHDLLRVECEGRVVWVAWDKFPKVVVLDEKGKLVRKKSIVETATIEFRKYKGLQ